MANNVKLNPRGIDKQIVRLQKTLYDRLASKLLPGKSVEGFGRVYRNMRDGKHVFEVYKGKNEYKDVSGLDGSSFLMHASGNTNISEDPVTLLQIVFFLNIDDFYNTTETRNDEELKEIAYNAVLTKLKGGLKEIIPGVEYVDGLLDGYLQGKTIMTWDMHPHVVFTITGNISYTYKNC